MSVHDEGSHSHGIKEVLRVVRRLFFMGGFLVFFRSIFFLCLLKSIFFSIMSYVTDSRWERFDILGGEIFSRRFM